MEALDKTTRHIYTMEYVYIYVCKYLLLMGCPGGSDGKESACNVGDLNLIPWLGRFPGEGHGNPL